MMVVPDLRALIIPELSIVAIVFLLDLKLAAFPEDTDASSLYRCPTFSVILDLFRVIVGFFTLTVNLMQESSALMVTIALPGFLDVIYPFESISAMLFLSILKVTLELLEVVAFSKNLLLQSIEMDALFSVIIVFDTVTRHSASKPEDLTVIVAFPDFLAMILPYELTCTIDELLLLNVGCLPLEVTAVR